MPAISSEIAKDIVKACHKLYARGLVANHDGNITFKIASDPPFYVATPTSFSKGDITENDLLLLDENGKVVEGKHKGFSEIAFHLSIYRVRKDVQCVVHAHPPTAAGFGIAGQEIGTPALPEAIVSLGKHILTSKFISPLDPDLQKSSGTIDLEINRMLNQSDAFIIPGNGAWTVGQDIMQTYYRMELVEHIAKQHLAATQLGGVKKLATHLIEELLAKRLKPKAVEITQSKPNMDLEKLREIVAAEVKNLFNSQE